ncbi:MAG: rRNA maturation RNase YbeY [Candidatus Pacebacteria bacterium CG10_big_fil_rev_8_21_14_0_10_56_10]|nr:MAG: rRNA maturation RNase YbeY [Candidatus Pacebacteria bacterium CG10_big_fil_rev_8_21_14_0_10_56_10]
MITVNLYVGSRYPVDRAKLRAKARQVLTERGISHAQLDVSVVGARKMRMLNEEKLNHQGATDVLSFPQHQKDQLADFPMPAGIPPHLGDVVVSFPEAIKTARRFGKRVDDQLCFYLEHGLLHLLGYHHD